MRKRQQRHDIIRDIIREHNVKTQRDLADQLQAEGYDCTQATISRDIMDMGLVKSREGFYVLPEEMRLQRMVSELVEEVHLAGNMVVVKTYSGGAAGVSAALDKANLKGALGTVAGDNTIMIATETPESAQDVAGAINRLRRR
ncbi:MAG: ArgR family transcriptional regulator [Raoultibacter sp.]